MNVVLLGGAGFVGSALAGGLIARGHQVRVLDRHPPPVAISGVEYLCAEIDDTANLQTALRDSTHMFYLAWSTTPGTSQRAPTREIAANLAPAARVLETLQRYPAIHLVFVSTGGAIYGNRTDTRVDTDVNLAPISNYGAGKAACEAFLHAHHAATGGPTTILRPSNLYGPGQAPRQGFGLVPALFACARDGHPFELWGEGEIVRDFLFIEDFVALCARIVEHADNATGCEVFNVGAGEGCSIERMIGLVSRVSGRAISVRRGPSRGVDVARIVLDAQPVQTRYGWRPMTSLAQGLALTWQWIEHTPMAHLD